MEKTKKAIKWLVIAIVLIILGCTLASGINTDLGKVDVSEIEYSTERGTMSAYLYMPDGAGVDNPRPVIVLTHGYLNSKEMQDAAAVEMSRRGYIVLVVDQYDHGGSRWTADIPSGTEMGTFWVWSMFDAVTYAYNQNFTLKDADGNGYIGCSGHSMGGLSTVMAIYFDEMQSLQSGHRMIYTAISQSADFSFTNMIAPTEDILKAYGNRTIGIISGHYDEFFFGEREGVFYKDFINSSEMGAQFLGLEDGVLGESGVFYDVEAGEVQAEGAVARSAQTGKHVVYLVDEAHAMNHFSTTCTGHLVDFFQTAFKGVTTSDMYFANMTSTNQVWLLKEIGNLIALVGFFLFFIPFITLITKVGFLKKAVTEETSVVPLPTSTGGKVAFWAVLIIFTLLPGVLYVSLMNKVVADIRVLEIIMGIFAVIMLIITLVAKAKASKDASGKFASYAKGGLIATVISVLMVAALFGYKLFAQNPWFNSTASNWSAYWAFILSFILIIIVIITYYFVNKPNGVGIEAYGIRIKPISVLAAFTTAALTFTTGYLILFICDGIFNVDFRFWTYAVKVFKVEHFLTMLKYVPMFFLFYLILSVLLNVNTRTLKHGYLVSALTSSGGCILWFIIQYTTVYITGTAMWQTSGMIAIGLLTIIPGMIIAAIFTRKIYDKTNNVWTAGFFNAMLFTMITVANTLLLWNLV